MPRKPDKLHGGVVGLWRTQGETTRFYLAGRGLDVDQDVVITGRVGSKNYQWEGKITAVERGRRRRAYVLLTCTSGGTDDEKVDSPGDMIDAQITVTDGNDPQEVETPEIVLFP